MKKPLAALAAVVLALGLAQGTTSAQAATKAAPKSSGYQPPPITWGPCDDPTLVQFGAQCGDLVVPRDYAHPGGAKIKVAVSRVVHTTEKSQGVMIVNPGGPGGSGRIYSIFQSFVPHGAGNSYDWIGFDPRGVGSSTPAIACDASFFKGDRPPYRPTTRKIHHQWVQRSKGYAKDCANSPGSALLNHVKTTDTVSDMESLRKALGQKKINYYGFSYGTYLGQVYATLHPDRVRRFIWDGTVDPNGVWYKGNQEQDKAFQTTFEIYFKWLAKNNATYHVGNTLKQVRSTYLSTLKTLDKHAEGGVLGGDELTDVFTSAGYYVYDWEDIAQAWSSYINDGDATGLIQRYTDANPTTPGADNGYAMYLGTQCTDARWPQSQRKLDRDNQKLDKNYFYMTWSNAWFNGPCAYWKYPSAKPVNVKGSKVHTPILMIGETYDAATPFAGSLVTRKLFPSASLIEGIGGSTHAGSLSGIACTDDTIATYLENGTVPARKSGNRSDKKCPPVPQPDPTAAQQRSLKASGGMPQVLRDALEQAQLHN